MPGNCLPQSGEISLLQTVALGLCGVLRITSRVRSLTMRQIPASPRENAVVAVQYVHYSPRKRDGGRVTVIAGIKEITSSPLRTNAVIAAYNASVPLPLR